MIKLRGKILVQTEKGILFKVEEDLCMHLEDKKIWFPKSRIKMPKRLDGQISIYVENWLYDSNVKVPNYAR